MADELYKAYLERFAARFGDKPEKSFVKFGKHMVQKLNPKEFESRWDRYMKLQEACRKILTDGSTISDAIMLDFEEACAWISIAAPNLLQMFRGELGDPSNTK